AFYIGSFFYMHTALFFFANIMIFRIYAVSYTATSTIQMQFSTRKKLARNSSRIWSIASWSLIVGGGIYMSAASKYAGRV
ncbi:hypothetical protein PENTCL1PPCAC_24902, partial [Pristionchus entomophagus]